MRYEDRKAVQKEWNENEFSVMVCTIAFGLGMEKRDIRCTVHFVLPKSLEDYNEEAGRAGLVGRRSECIVFYSGLDVSKLKGLFRFDRQASNGDYNQKSDCLFRYKFMFHRIPFGQREDILQKAE